MEYRTCGQEHTFTEKGNSTLNMVTLKFNGSDCYTYTVRATDGAHSIAVVGMVDSRTGKCSPKIVIILTLVK